MNEKVKESMADGVFPKAYEDLVQPSARSIGNTISLFPRTLGVWLGKWEKWIINGEESIRVFREAVKDKLKRIPEDDLTEPEPYVVIPAIQQLSYCVDSEELREMYANLLVASMNKETKWSVHPSYIDVIKQLTPDEARILNRLPAPFLSEPAVDILVKRPQMAGHFTIFKNISVIGLEAECAVEENTPVYLDNLSRLGLISINEIALADAWRYDKVESCPDFCKKIKEAREQGEVVICKKTVGISGYGEAFRKIVS